MIIVKNTKELEERYNLNLIPDNEPIRVIGGMYGKNKYVAEGYINRTTYSARQLKQIIQQMKEIEKTIPFSWNQWQKSKYIYIVLANHIEYNFDKTSYDYNNPSDLSSLIHRKGICAGYSLIFKEMMDRQGIKCDYIRGLANSSINSPKTDKHAWNVITIDGTSIPVDLTWDSDEHHNGKEKLSHFGNDHSFSQTHEQDDDEISYNLSIISNDFIDSIDISQSKSREGLNLNELQYILNSSLDQTINKAMQLVDVQAGHTQGVLAITNYVLENNPDGFTRDGMARANIEEYFSKSDMIFLLVRRYVEQCVSKPHIHSDILGNALKQTLIKYTYLHAEKALRDYILSGSTQRFTRDGMARDNIEQYMTQDSVLKIIIDDYVTREIEIIKATENLKNTYSSSFSELTPFNLREESNIKDCFSADEFDDVYLPPEVNQSIVQKAIQWISSKRKNYHDKSEDSELRKSSEKSDNQR